MYCALIFVFSLVMNLPVTFAGEDPLIHSGSVSVYPTEPNTYVVSVNLDQFGLEQKKYLVNAKSLSPAVLATVKKYISSYEDGLEIPKTSTRDFPSPPPISKADCSEKPISYSSIERLAKSSKIKDQNDFLRLLPNDTLQTFTFNYDSKSSQKTAAGTDKALYPRVIRTSADGKLIITYTCDPRSEAYNKVEVMRYDDDSSTFKLSELDFNQRLGFMGLHSSKRIHDHPKNCASCHAPRSDPNDIRPNWPMYPRWKSFYGGRDDTFFPASQDPREVADAEKEKSDYLRFRKVQKNNPCYSSLPWPKDSVPGADLYPYSDEYKSKDYHIRPNFKLTETLSRLEAKKISNKLKHSPEYSEVKYLLAAEALGGCGLDIEKEMSKHLPNYHLSPAGHEDYSLYDPTSKISGAQNLYSSSLALGIPPSDWNLNIDDRDNPAYDAAIPNSKGTRGMGSKDLAISHVIQGEILRDIARENPTVGNNIAPGRGSEEIFGKGFSCIDQIGGEAVIKDELKKAEMCSLLTAKQNQVDSAQNISCPNTPTRSLASLVDAIKANNVKSEPLKSSPEQIGRGKDLVSRTCVQCHTSKGGMPEDLQFFENDKVLKTALKDSSFQKTMSSSLHAKGSRKMPANANFTEDQILDVEAYLRTMSPE